MLDFQVMSGVHRAGECLRVNTSTICALPTLAAAARLYCILSLSPPSSLCSDGDRKQVSGKWSCTKPTTASHYPLNSTRLITMTMTGGLLLDHWDGTQGRGRNMQVQNIDSTAATHTCDVCCCNPPDRHFFNRMMTHCTLSLTLQTRLENSIPVIQSI